MNPQPPIQPVPPAAAPVPPVAPAPVIFAHAPHVPRVVVPPRIGGVEAEANGDEVAWTGGLEDGTLVEPVLVD